MLRFTAKLGFVICIALLLAGLAAIAQAAMDETTLVSRQSAADGGALANDYADDASISADGRYVAFDSQADNLSTADDNSVPNVFVRDTQTNTTTLVSRKSATGGGAGSTTESGQPAISADGRYVAFYAEGNNLDAAANNTYRNIFVRDTQTNTTTLVSRQTAGTGANDDSRHPAISADGRYVGFDSEADNLSTADNDTDVNVFVRDTQANTTTLISRQSATDGLSGGDASSDGAKVSSDGRYVSFQSDADNLSTEDDNSYTNVFVRDTQTNTTTLVSRQSATDGAAAANNDSGNAQISSDGRSVAFNSKASNLSADSGGASNDVYVRDTQANTTTLVSRQSAADGGAAANTGGQDATISASGRYVTFDSSATNLSSLDGDAFGDTFVRDTQANTTTLVSRQSAADGGAGANGESYYGAVSADGRYVAFTSQAANLGANGTDGEIFLRDVLGGPAAAPEPGSPAAKDTRAPKLSATSPKKASIKKGVLVVSVTCDEACSATASASVNVPGSSKVFKLKPVKRSLAAGAKTKLKIKLSKKTVKAGKRALKKHKRVKATVSVGATDAAGNSSKAQRKIRLVK